MPNPSARDIHTLYSESLELLQAYGEISTTLIQRLSTEEHITVGHAAKASVGLFPYAVWSAG